MARTQYKGNPIVDANGQLIEPSFVINVKLRIGSPEIEVDTSFVVIKSLPFSCIIGQQTLQLFETWEVSNKNQLMTFNKKHVAPIFNYAREVQTVNLISTQKTVVAPFSSTLIDVRASGIELDKFRPTTDVTVLTEGNERLCNRLLLEIPSSISILTHQNCSQKLLIHNLSAKPKTVAKGSKIATGSTEYEECLDVDGELIEEDLVGTIFTDRDVIEILCSKITDLNKSEMTEVRKLFQEYKDCFTVSNDKIGSTNVAEFDVPEKLQPVAVPLRRVPLHQREIVQELLKRHEDLNFIEPIDSPFRASTVLVKKKNPANSSDVTDQYRLAIDYRALNKSLTNSAWPSPSIDDCLDAIGDSSMFSSIDFNSGYHQILCTERAKRALAFSPGYGFSQYTCPRMPEGVKTASSYFQRAMCTTFKNRESCILPPFFDDIVIKGKGFKNHLENVRIILGDVRKAGFTLNTLKCSFFQKKISYLGHIVSENRIIMDPKWIEAITSMPPPSDGNLFVVFSVWSSFATNSLNT